MKHLSCPVCFRDIPTNRVMGHKAFCDCGHTIHIKSENKTERKASLSLILFTVVLIGAIVHAINWDVYFFDIIPLKMKQITATASATELKSIATICRARKKPNCEIQALENAFEVSKEELEGLQRVGEIYMEKKNYQAAVKTYSIYFKNGGKSDAARHSFAKALGEIGQFKEAKKQFQYLVQKYSAKPQFQVGRTYVEILMKNNDYVTARNVIAQYRRAGPTAAMFLEKEWKYLNESGRTPAQASASSPFDP